MLFSALSLFTAGVAGAAASSSLAVRQTVAQAFASSNDGTLNLTQQSAPVSGTGSPNGQTTWSINVDDSSTGTKQTITGFGSAITDSTVIQFNTLSSALQAKLTQALFSSSGANFQLIRHTIGSSDMSPTNYTYDDNNRQVDLNLSNFTLGAPGNAMAALLAKFRQAQPNLTILGSPWSAPKWMTSGNAINTKYASQFAQYFVKYLQAFEASKATVNYITIQNEPLHNGYANFTMFISAQTSGNLIQNYIGPAIASSNLTNKPQIWAFDHNTYNYSYPETVVSIAGQYIGAVAWHCYSIEGDGGPDWTVLSTFHSNHNNITQYMSECWTYLDDSWTQAINSTMGPLQNWASGAISWPMGTDINGGPHLAGGCDKCAGLFRVDNGNYTLSRDYYMLSQFSKYIPKGATVQNITAGVSSDGTGIQAIASNNPDGTKTVVLQNKFNAAVYVTVSFKSGAKWSGSLYKQSLSSWILPN